MAVVVVDVAVDAIVVVVVVVVAVTGGAEVVLETRALVVVVVVVVAGCTVTSHPSALQQQRRCPENRASHVGAGAATAGSTKRHPPSRMDGTCANAALVVV